MINVQSAPIQIRVNGGRGPRGYSAYEIAVQNGFVGTEQEWLDFLQAPQNVVRYDVPQSLSEGVGGEASQALENLKFPPYPDLATASAAEGHNVAFFNTTINRVQMTV